MLTSHSWTTDSCDKTLPSYPKVGNPGFVALRCVPPHVVTRDRNLMNLNGFQDMSSR